MEEFDVLKDFYFPIQDQEKLYSSNAYKNLKNNNIDTAELEGDEPEPLELVPWPVERVSDLIEGGEFSEARAIAALTLCKPFLL